jgi:hypothetical protein
MTRHPHGPAALRGAKAAALRAAGKTTAETAALLGVTPQTVRNYCRRAGIELKRGRPRKPRCPTCGLPHRNGPRPGMVSLIP